MAGEVSRFISIRACVGWHRSNSSAITSAVSDARLTYSMITAGLGPPTTGM
jgi:hypothetical protein